MAADASYEGLDGFVEAVASCRGVRVSRPTTPTGRVAWNPRSGLNHHRNLMFQAPGETYGGTFSPDGLKLAVLERDGAVVLWGVAAGSAA